MARAFQSRCYCTNLRRGAGMISDYYDRALRATGVNSAQFYLLLSLCRLEQATITQWAEQVGLERSTMVRNVKVLRQRGWVRELPRGEGRGFTMTEEGERVLALAVPIWQKVQFKIEMALGAADSEALLRIAEKLQTLDEPRV